MLSSVSLRSLFPFHYVYTCDRIRNFNEAIHAATSTIVKWENERSFYGRLLIDLEVFKATTKQKVSKNISLYLVDAKNLIGMQAAIFRYEKSPVLNREHFIHRIKYYNDISISINSY